MRKWAFVLIGFIILSAILVITLWQRGFIKGIINPSPTPPVTSFLDTYVETLEDPYVETFGDPYKVETFKDPSKVETLGPPDELGKDFDQTKNSPNFIINSVDENTKIVNLSVVWPNKILNLRVDSKITCEYGDIKIYENGTESEATSDELLSKMKNAKPKDAIFSGICVNEECTEINKQCELSIF